MSVRLKICGITRRSDLEVCVDAGVDAIGFNFWPKSRRALAIDEAATLVREGTGSSLRVGVFVDETPQFVCEAVRRLGLGAVQLHGDRDVAPFVALGVPWIMVVRGTPALEAVAVPERAPEFVLLDAATPGYGGAGIPTDFAWAAAAVRHFAPLPVWLAGGIDPDNADDAIARVRPAGIDVASGVEVRGATRGEKSAEAIARLVAICHKGRG